MAHVGIGEDRQAHIAGRQRALDSTGYAQRLQAARQENRRPIPSDKRTPLLEQTASPKRTHQDPKTLQRAVALSAAGLFASGAYLFARTTPLEALHAFLVRFGN
ncbi:hypothetical protein FB645_005304 [Coemansia sp. IMI 203386]|nr:hypothetical protein FB645_005304 [Coemansia sp. IMI 203386]